MCISILSQPFGCGKLKTSTSPRLTLRNPGTRCIAVCSSRSVALRLNSRAPSVGFQTATKSPSTSSGSIESLGMRKEARRKTWQKNHKVMNVKIVRTKFTLQFSMLFIYFIALFYQLPPHLFTLLISKRPMFFSPRMVMNAE